MGYIDQASASVSSSSKMTLSMWVNVAAAPGLGVYPKFISWGNLDATNDVIRGVPDGLNSYISFTDGTPASLYTQIRSPLDTIHAFKGGSSDNYIGYAPGGGTTTDTGAPGDDFDVYTTAIIQTVTDFVDFAINTWFHIFVVFDVSAGADLVTATSLSSPAFPYSYRYTQKVYINGTNRSSTSVTSLEQDGGAVRFFGGTVKAIPNTFTSVANGTLPVWPIALNGEKISIPGKSLISGVEGNPSGITRVTDVQIWVGQYIDPAVHIDKFYSAGAPVNPSVAQAAFGTPDYRLGGPASGITTNHGTGGDFTLNGTASDATPGP